MFIKLRAIAAIGDLNRLVDYVSSYTSYCSCGAERGIDEKLSILYQLTAKKEEI